MQRVERGGGGPRHAPDVSRAGGGGEVLRSQRFARGLWDVFVFAGGAEGVPAFRGSEVLRFSVVRGGVVGGPETSRVRRSEMLV